VRRPPFLRRRTTEAFLILSAAACVAAPAYAQSSAAPPEGRTVYLAHCAQCHEQNDARVPQREALQRMPRARIVRALDAGAMLAIGMTMHRDERIAVAEYLGTDAAASGPPPTAFCADRSVRLAATSTTAWNGWSPTPNNARFQATGAGLTADRVPKLKLKWAFGFAGDVAAFAAPTVIDGQVFVGSAGGVVHAMRAENGCLQWVFQANGPVRAAIVVAPVEGGRHALLFGDLTGWFYAVSAETGELLWKQHVETHDSTRLTAAAAVHDGVVYVPVSSWEEARAGDPTYACCTFRGSVVALRVRDGVQLWKTYMTETPPKEIGKNASNAPRFGPSGVGIWATPTVDAKRRLLYIATGDNYTEPASSTGDAVLALDMRDGRIVWTKQITEHDVFNGSCRNAPGNCPAGAGPDYDFGSSAILLDGGGRREMLLAGQKSGIVFALDPKKQGEIIWQTRIGKGGTNGGIEWGMATDGDLVYATVSDVARTRQDNNLLDPRRYALDPQQGGGLTALRVKDGSKVWYAAPAPCPAGAPAGCSPAQPGAVTQIPGVVFATSNDGHIRAHAAASGKVLWDYDTAREFATVNNVPAHGGSIDGPGPVVSNGLVLIGSGYPRNGGMPGNVLLAFGAD